eukprot:scaffold33330_cov66-Phaeocystis_antarctica.AAC.5
MLSGKLNSGLFKHGVQCQPKSLKRTNGQSQDRSMPAQRCWSAGRGPESRRGRGERSGAWGGPGLQSQAGARSAKSLPRSPSPRALTRRRGGANASAERVHRLESSGDESYSCRHCRGVAPLCAPCRWCRSFSSRGSLGGAA